jgi:hypothetical protein
MNEQITYDFFFSQNELKKTLHTLESTAHHLQGLQFAPRKSRLLPLSSVALTPQNAKDKTI